MIEKFDPIVQQRIKNYEIHNIALYIIYKYIK